MEQKNKVGISIEAVVQKGNSISNNLGLSTHYNIECFDKNNKLKWVESFDNLVVNTGLDDVLNKYFKGSTYTAAFYVGLTSASPTVAPADTLASNAGWNEIVPYSNSVRPTLTLGTVASQSVDNSASKAVFNINGTATIGGAFIATSSTKSETASLLYGAGAFSVNKDVTDGDTLNVTVTLTSAAS